MLNPILGPNSRVKVAHYRYSRDILALGNPMPK